MKDRCVAFPENEALLSLGHTNFRHISQKSIKPSHLKSVDIYWRSEAKALMFEAWLLYSVEEYIFVL